MYVSVLWDRFSTILRMGNLICMYTANSYKKKLTIVALSAGPFHNIVAFTIARQSGNLLPDNIKISQIDKCW